MQMTVSFRRLAGLTSRESNLWRSHFDSMGPPGILLSRCMDVRSLVREVDVDRQDGEAARDQQGEHAAGRDDGRAHSTVRQAERLRRARDPGVKCSPNQENRTKEEGDDKGVLVRLNANGKKVTLPVAGSNVVGPDL